ncbi:hypothetical protein JTB14_034400 [Gonioctena quinquepunctata]|nr:hypothetical protein JTB14_034400 [Gonioctena quinquepunctata]
MQRERVICILVVFVPGIFGKGVSDESPDEFDIFRVFNKNTESPNFGSESAFPEGGEEPSIYTKPLSFDVVISYENGAEFSDGATIKLSVSQKNYTRQSNTELKRNVQKIYDENEEESDTKSRNVIENVGDSSTSAIPASILEVDRSDFEDEAIVRVKMEVQFDNKNVPASIHLEGNLGNLKLNNKRPALEDVAEETTEKAQAESESYIMKTTETDDISTGSDSETTLGEVDWRVDERKSEGASLKFMGRVMYTAIVSGVIVAVALAIIVVTISLAVMRRKGREDIQESVA